MDHERLSALADRLKEHRDSKGVREAAREIGISPATLSRVERGNVPDIETFGKICNWLGDDPATYLGHTSSSQPPKLAQVHFKKDSAINPDAAAALSRMIILAHEALRKSEEINAG